MTAPRFTLASRIRSGAQVCARQGHLRNLVAVWRSQLFSNTERGEQPKGLRCPRCGTSWLLDGTVTVDPPKREPITEQQAWVLIEGDLEFTVTPGHIAMLRAANVRGGEQAIDQKRPFGNSGVWRDVAELVDPEFTTLREGAQDDYLDEHHEALVQMLAELGHVLAIAVAGAGAIEPGRYVRKSSWASWHLAGA